MTATIGPYSFLTWDGIMPQATRAHREVIRPGEDGMGVLWDAWRVPVATITTTTIANDSAERDKNEIAIRRMISTSVSVTDPLGRIYPDVLVLDANVRRSQSLITDQWVLITTWKLLSKATAPTTSTP